MIDPTFSQTPIRIRHKYLAKGVLLGKSKEVVVFEASTKAQNHQENKKTEFDFPNTPTKKSSFSQQLSKKSIGTQKISVQKSDALKHRRNNSELVRRAEKLSLIPQSKQPGLLSLIKNLPDKFEKKSAQYHDWASSHRYYYRQQQKFNSAENSQPVDGVPKNSRQSIWQSAAHSMLTIVMIIALVVSSIIILPEITNALSSSSSSVQEVAEEAAQHAEFDQPVEVEQPYMPVINPDLPQGSWVSIPRIGVYSELLASQDPQEALDRGTWMVPDFGRPGDYSQPTIIAAHRYGWDWWWQTDYWRYNSFYLLTETEPGDRVEVIYGQRKWTYEIYAAEEGEQITDYSADLILYTCKYLNSPVRHFRYAKVVEV